MGQLSSGSCLCGVVKFEVRGAFDSFYLCHCTFCQKDTGAAYAANMFSTTAQLTWVSGQDLVKTFNLPGTRHAKSFCRECGSAVPMRVKDPALLMVPAGSLDTRPAQRPDAHIFWSSRAPWDEGLMDTMKFEKFPIQGEFR